MVEAVAIIGALSAAISITNILIQRFNHVRTRTDELERLCRQIKAAAERIVSCRNLAQLANFQLQYRHPKLSALGRALLRDNESRLSIAIDAVEHLFHNVNEKYIMSHSGSQAMRVERARRDLDELSEHLDKIHEICNELDKEMTPIDDDTDFTPDFCVPQLPTYHVLEFSQERDPLTEEGVILSLLQKKWMNPHTEGQFNQVTAPIIGVDGLGGVGKTVALIGLCRDDSVKTFFHDGIYFMRFGSKVTDQHVVQQLQDIIRRAGGHDIAEQLTAASTPAFAAERASDWFRQRCVLIICDDLRRTSSQQDGYIPILKTLLSDESRMIISSHDKELLKDHCTERVTVRPRNCIGEEAQFILIRNATSADNSLIFGEHEDVLLRILRYCGGMPLALVVAGKALRRRKQPIQTWHQVLKDYENHLSMNKRDLFITQVQDYNNGGNLESVIRTSLDIANTECFGTWRSWVHHPRCHQLFNRLCIMKKQELIPSRVFGYLWNELDHEMVTKLLGTLDSLNLVHSEMCNDVVMLRMQDVVIDFCELESKIENRFYKNHYRFLQRLFCRSSQLFSSPFLQSLYSWVDVLHSTAHVAGLLRLSRGEQLLELEQCTRLWWETPSGEMPISDITTFIHTNLITMLCQAGRTTEALGVLTNASWTMACIPSIGIAPIFHDFNVLISSLSRIGDEEGISPQRDEFISALQRIRDSISDMGRYVTSDITSCATQIHGRLSGMDDSSSIIKRYLRTSREGAPLIWLRPLSRSWPEPFGLQKIEITTDLSQIDHLGFDPRSRVIRAIGPTQERHPANAALLELEITSRGQKIQEMPGTVLSLSENGKMLACEMHDRRTSLVQLTGHKTKLNVKEKYKASSTLFRFSTEGSLFVVGSNAEHSERKFRDRSKVEWFDNANRANKSSKLFLTEIAVSRDGSLVAAAYRPNIVKVWKASNGEKIAKHEQLPGRAVYKMAVNGGPRRAVAAACEDDSFFIWKCLPVERITTFAHFHKIHDMRFCKNGYRVCFSDENGKVKVLCVERGAFIFSLEASFGAVKSLALSADGKWAVGGGTDGVVAFWDLEANRNETPERPQHNGRVLGLCITQDGTKARSIGGSEVREWNLRDGSPQLRQEVRINGDPVKMDCALINSGERRFVFLSGDTMRWMEYTDNGVVGGRVMTRQNVVAMEMSRNSGVVTTLGPGILQQWDFLGEKQNEARSAYSRVLSRMDASADGTRCVSTVGKRIVWTAWGGTIENASMTKVDVKHPLTSVCLSGDGEQACFGFADGQIEVWLWSASRPLWQAEAAAGHSRAVRCTTSSFNGSVLVSGSQDKTMFIWKGRNGPEGVRFNIVASVSLSYMPCCMAHIARCGDDGEGALVGDERGFVTIFQIHS